MRSGPGSVVDEVEPRIRELLPVWPTMPATVVAERIGWEHSIRVLRARVSELRPVYLPPDPASRTAYVAGEIAQCAFWFPEHRGPCRVGAGAERDPAAGADDGVWVLEVGSAVLVPSRNAEDLYAGWGQLIAALGAVPRP